MKPNKFVAYFRVSTQKQGKSGLGLEAQREIVKNYVEERGTILQEFIEVESGRKKDRPQLKEAVDFCKKNKACLVIAKLDRLARSISFIFALKESGVEFECCDLPELNTLNLGIFSTLAQYEAELISKRTKDALAAKKRQGFKLGSPQNLTDEARKEGRAARKKIALERECNRNAFEFARDYRDKGESYQKIANALNKYSLDTPKNAKFYACSVRNLLKLYGYQDPKLEPPPKKKQVPKKAVSRKR